MNYVFKGEACAACGGQWRRVKHNHDKGKSYDRDFFEV